MQATQTVYFLYFANKADQHCVMATLLRNAVVWMLDMRKTKTVSEVKTLWRDTDVYIITAFANEVIF